MYRSPRSKLQIHQPESSTANVVLMYTTWYTLFHKAIAMQQSNTCMIQLFAVKLAFISFLTIKPLKFCLDDNFNELFF